MKKRNIIIVVIGLFIVVFTAVFFATRKNDNTNIVVENVPEVEVENNSNNDSTNTEEVIIETPVVEGDNEVGTVKDVVYEKVIVEDDDDQEHDQPIDDRDDEDFPVMEGNENEIIGDNDCAGDDYVERRQAALKIMYEHSTLPKVIIND